MGKVSFLGLFQCPGSVLLHINACGTTLSLLSIIHSGKQKICDAFSSTSVAVVQTTLPLSELLISRGGHLIPFGTPRVNFPSAMNK